MSVSTMAKNLIGSEIIKIGGEINEMIKKGHEICNLTIGDFNPAFYPIPKQLEHLIVKAYSERHTNYPPANGVAELRNSIVKFIQSELNLSYSADDVLVAGGSRPLIYAVYRAIIDEYDRVVFPTPSWNNNHYCHLSGATQVMVETSADNNFMPKASDIAKHLEGATMLALCSPLNPTGTMFSKADLEEICDLVIAENHRRGPNHKPLYILYDHIYWMLTFGENKHVDPVNLRPELKEYVIYIDGISKSFAATGVRVGWAYGPSKVIQQMKSILGHIGAWSPKAEQMATAAYLQDKADMQQFMLSFKQQVQASLDTLYQSFKTLKHEGFEVDAIAPMGAIYLTVKVDYAGKKTPDGKILINSKDINSYLISEAGFAMVPFSAFGSSDSANWFRLSIGGASLDEIKKAIPRVKAALLKLS